MGLRTSEHARDIPAMLKILTATPLPPVHAKRLLLPRTKENRHAPFVDDITVSKVLARQVQLRRIAQRPAVNGSPQHSPGPRDQALEDEELAFALFAQETTAFEDASRNADALQELAWTEEMDRYNHEVAVALSEDKEPPPMPEFLQRGWKEPEEMEALSAPESPVGTAGMPPPQAKPSDSVSHGKARMSQSLPVSMPHTPTSDNSDDEDDDIETLRAQWAIRTRVVRLRTRLADVGFSVPPTPPSPPSPPTPPPPECCTICGDDITDTIVRLDCGHTFDVGCVREMFERATVDEELFPPKCCTGAVALSAAEPHLDPALVARYHKKAREFSTADRVYCHVAACAAFLGPATPDAAEPETLRCEACGAGTCAACKEQTHPGVPCHFAAEDAVLDLGRAQGWQRCGACKHLVELSIGCYHIVCRCGSQWCYKCAAPWKTCGCELFYVPPEDPEE